jgi:hypothetical protein
MSGSVFVYTTQGKYRKTNMNTKIQKSPHKSRAIHRARDLKYKDDGRGEEAPVDMFYEELNSKLSSRKATPFSIVHMYEDFSYKATKTARGYDVTMEKVIKEWVIARGVYYPSPNAPSITMLHELEGRQVHLMVHDRMLTEPNFGRKGKYKVVF